MEGERRNLELKAKDPDPKRSLQVCEELGAEDRGTLLQRDTYFAGTLGVIAVVEKARRLFIFKAVRIHLDSVEGLGSFIEFEAVAEPGEEDLQRFQGLLCELRKSFEIEDVDLIGESYCDLAAKNPHLACNT
ncbi:MAG: CYTH domain-containing protein [Actinomycetota bacterium]|nr:CYTH domain-containing protein [Actinomycetota bacterium]